MGAIVAMQAAADDIDVTDIVARAERAARLLARNGFTAVRTHVDIHAGSGVSGIEALMEVRRRVADLIDVQIVALSGWPIVGQAGADQRALLADALDAGADLVGGCPHLEEDGSDAATEYFLQIAADRSIGVDLHTDENLDPSSRDLAKLAALVAAGFDHPVTASHCVSLGMQSPTQQRATAEAVAEAGISVIVLPHTNLYLQGRGQHPMPRGLTAVDALRAAGVTVAAGADNLQDPFNPVGRGCPFETAGLMIMAAHLLAGEAWGAVSSQAGVAIGRSPGAIVAGRPADLFAVRADSLREAIALGPADRLVWKSGRRVAMTTPGWPAAPETKS
jgi:cytosine deaminase